MKKNYFLFRLRSLALLILFLFPFVSNAQSGSSFGIRPAFPREDNPRTESIFIHTINPGDFVSDGVSVINNTATAKDLSIYVTDSTPSSGGAFACKQQGQEKTGVGSWIKLGVPDSLDAKLNEDQKKITFILNAGEKVVVPFDINVPVGALVGEHNGCVLVQENKPADRLTSGVSVSVRSGLRVAVTVPGELTRSLQLVSFTTNKKDNKTLVFESAVRNAGNVSIDADVLVRVRSWLGFKVAEYGGQYPILSTQTSEWNFEMPRRFFGGWYVSRLIVSYDESEQAEIGKNTDTKLEVIKSNRVVDFVPPKPLAWVFYIIVIVFILLGFLIIVISIKRKAWIQKHWRNYNVKEGDTLKTLSKSYQIDWRILVKVNKLKPPYVFEQGQAIKVPPRKKS